MGALEAYQTDCLILLVGTNPLPNYVAALLLTKQDGCVYLLHSGGERGTGQIAARLKQSIEASNARLRVEPREIDESDGLLISRKVEEILTNLPDTVTIGLHYTGGTKVMAVHVYRTVQRLRPRAVFSYLDARSLSMIIDTENSAPIRKVRVGEACPVHLHSLVALHGIQLGEVRREGKLPTICRALAEVHSTEDGVKAWRKWCDENLRRKDKPDRFRPKSELDNINLPEEQPLNIVSQAFTALLQMDVPAKLLGEVAGALRFKAHQLAEWLDGKWLEDYVLGIVGELSREGCIDDYGASLKPEGDRQFEFDIGVMRGYQLFGISCTTEYKKRECKLKLFEAYVRTRQLGGDEARTGLVCCHKNADRLRQEVEESWFTEGKVEVFGREDLLCLPHRLQSWFEGAAGSFV